MKKVIAIVMMLVMTLSVIVGCGQQTPATSPDASQPAQSTQSAQPASQQPDQSSPSGMQTYDVKMSIQYAPQQCVPYWHAKENGVFDKYGIVIDYDNVPWYSAGAPQLEAQPGGEWDIGLIGYTAAIRAATAYDMANIGMCGFDTSDAVICREDSDIYQAGKGQIDGYPNIYGTADLWKGKTVILTLATTRDVCMQMVLGAMGLTYDDVTVLNMDNDSGWQAFLNGEGDLWVPAGSFGAQALANDSSFKKIADINDVDLAMFNTFVTPIDWAAANRDEVVHFMAAFLEAIMWCGDPANKETMAEYYQTIMKEEGGIDYTLAEAGACVDKVLWPDLAFFESYSTDPDGDGQTVYQDYLEKFFDGHAMVGIADPADKQTVLGSADTTYLDEAIALYKSMNNIQ